MTQKHTLGNVIWNKNPLELRTEAGNQPEDVTCPNAKRSGAGTQVSCPEDKGRRHKRMVKRQALEPV